MIYVAFNIIRFAVIVFAIYFVVNFIIRNTAYTLGEPEKFIWPYWPNKDK